MDLLPTEEQQQIIDSATAVLGNEFAVDRLLHLPDNEPAIAATQLQQVAALGWLGIGLEENHGGVGYGLCEEALLFAELGKHLIPPSILASVLGARVAALAADQSIAADILEGRSRVALGTAIAVRGNSIADTVEGRYLLYEAAEANYVLLADENGAALVATTALEIVEPGLCIDASLSMAEVSATACKSLAFVSAAQDNVFQRGALLTSALLLGIAEATLARSVEYAKEREQFDKPIGSFQAIKHYCADMAIRCESARAMLYHCSLTLQDGQAAGLFDLSTTKTLATDAAIQNANTAVQIHGGMGFTREMDIHLFVKRAQVLATLFGNDRQHLRTLLAQPRPD